MYDVESRTSVEINYLIILVVRINGISTENEPHGKTTRHATERKKKTKPPRYAFSFMQPTS